MVTTTIYLRLKGGFLFRSKNSLKKGREVNFVSKVNANTRRTPRFSSFEGSSCCCLLPVCLLTKKTCIKSLYLYLPLPGYFTALCPVPTVEMVVVDWTGWAIKNCSSPL